MTVNLGTEKGTTVKELQNVFDTFYQTNIPSALQVYAERIGYDFKGWIIGDKSGSILQYSTDRNGSIEFERYLLSSALTGIISQKLARRLCPKCKKIMKARKDTCQSTALYDIIKADLTRKEDFL